MELTALSNIFDVTYGNSFELNTLELCDVPARGVNFVSRTARNNGVSAVVEPILDIPPFDAGLITVSLGGSVLESFVQPNPFYTGYHIMVLKPKRKMSDEEKLFYCACIESNKYRYNYGRQANRTLRGLQIPRKAPTWLKGVKADLEQDIKDAYNNADINFDVNDWDWFQCGQLFDIERGKGPRLNELNKDGNIPFVTATDQNNGWNGAAGYSVHSGNVISVTRNGSVGEAFYQPIPFASTEDVHIFNPKFPMNMYIALFFITVLKMEKYRYNYGRKWGMKRMNDTFIKLPVTSKGKPDFLFMEKFIKSLPYSSSLDNSIVEIQTASEPIKKIKIGLTDAELAAKYDTGERVDFDAALNKMAKAPSKFALAKPDKTKQ